MTLTNFSAVHSSAAQREIENIGELQVSLKQHADLFTVEGPPNSRKVSLLANQTNHQRDSSQN